MKPVEDMTLPELQDEIEYQVGNTYRLPDEPLSFMAVKEVVTMLVAEYRLHFNVATLVPNSDPPVLYATFVDAVTGMRYEGSECLVEEYYFELAIGRAAVLALRALGVSKTG